MLYKISDKKIYMLNNKGKVIKLKNCILASDNFIKINKKLKSKCFWAM